MPRPSGSAPPHRHTAGPLRTREELASLRPDLLDGYDAALPGARASILARLLGALDREPLPGLLSRRPGEATFAAAPTRVTVRYPADAARPFARVASGLTATVVGGAQIADPRELVRLLWGDVPLAGEIDNSVANLALARAHQPAQGLPGPGDPDALGLIEQLVTDGHPLHPCCRTRGGMTVADVLAYAPEHSPVIRLRRLRVPRDRWYGQAPPILFAHPWQADRLVAKHPWLVPDGETDPVRPLMSLRTVAPLDGGPHIKTAVDVQMTSAVRTVSPAAVHNGPVLSRLLRRLTADQPIEILAEIAAGAVIVDGEPQRHLAHVLREAPQLKPGELAVPLAAVPLLTVQDPYEWMGLLAEVFFAPITRVLARGVALEAHGQNALVVLEDGRPTRMLYRDLGGVRVSAARLRAIGIDPPRLHGDLPSDDPAELRTKLAAAAFGTVAAELIAAFGADDDRLWGIIARAVRATGTEDVPHLLKDPLPVKATTAMRLATDPLDDRWALLPNPMADHA
ncbi:IucA/IucC family protein [Actinoplanes solisilvae]|uniref:IucA/IucC family protein n=1 Tax=Actinoplanes solisilvae TaxID=2486853 RepID=UPI000FD93DDA|nr:IucA/IucC family protein [Actinoplanes solisilvae]